MGFVAENADWLDRLHIWLDHEQGLAIWVTALATAGLAIGIFVARSALRDAKRTRHASLMMDLSRRWEDSAAGKSLRLAGAYGSQGILDLIDDLDAPPSWESAEERQSQLDNWDSLTRWLDLAEAVGVIYVDSGIDGKVIYNMWGPTIADGWDTWEKAIYRERERSGLRGAYRNFQLLGLEMKDRLTLERKSRRIRLFPAAAYLWRRKLVRTIKSH